VQLTITAAFVCAGCFYAPFKPFILANFWLQLTASIISLIVFYAIIYIRSASRKVPLNYILLTIFTVCESYGVVAITILYDNKTVAIAAILTAAVVIALTIYACTTKTDITVCGGLMFVLGMVLLVALFLSIFIQNRVFQLIVSCITVVIFSIYLVYDTQLILGKGELKLTVDDYIFAAMNLYLDIIVLFIEILKIIGSD
jgi:FtsH-binding integral membrane protein